MRRQLAALNDQHPHEDKIRRYRIGRWVTDCRLAKGWTMVDVAMRLHSSYRSSHLGNQGRISELETGNGVKRDRWTPEILQFLYGIFQPCPPPPDDPWAYSEEYEALLRKQAAEEEARRQAMLARLQGRPQLGLELWDDGEAPPSVEKVSRRQLAARGAPAPTTDLKL
jgi:hypothetical protein